MRIALASDHAGFPLKQELADWLREQGHDVDDLGTNSGDSVDYPEFGQKLARAVATGSAERGVAVCGSGIGISIAINREPKCRCARVDVVTLYQRRVFLAVPARDAFFARPDLTTTAHGALRPPARVSIPPPRRSFINGSRHGYGSTGCATCAIRMRRTTWCSKCSS